MILLFQIKDKGELHRAIRALEHRVPLANRRQIRGITRSIKTERSNACLLADLEEEWFASLEKLKELNFVDGEYYVNKALKEGKKE